MSQRTSVPGDGAWHQIATTGPATVQLLTVGVSVMVEAATASPTGIDGLVLNDQTDSHHFTLADPIWAQVVQSGQTAVVDVQPEAT